jgi:hypothetical protein
MPLAFKVSCPSCGAGCDTALVLNLPVCWSDGFRGVTSYSGFLSIGVYFVVSQSWCGVSRLLVEFLRVQASVTLEFNQRLTEMSTRRYFSG